MLAFLQTLISFFAVCLLSAFTARKFKISAGFTPLLVLCCIMFVCTMLGYLNLLQFSVWLVLALSLFALIHMILTRKQGGFSVLLSPGFMLFCFAGVVFISYFAIRKPVAQEWDEFMLWVTSVKLMKMEDVLFYEVQSGFPWNTTQKPGFAVLSYFFNYFGEYEAWRVYAAYDVLIISVWGTAIASIKKSKWFIAVPGAIIMFLMQFFHVASREIYTNFTFINAYADYPMGILCVGMLAFYFNMARIYKHKCTAIEFCKRIAVPLFIISAAISLCKDTGLAFSLVVSAIIGADLLFSYNKNSEFYEGFFKIKTLLPKLITILIMFFGAIFVFVTSSIYLSSLGFAQGVVSDASGLGYFQMVTEGTKQLLGLPAGELGLPYVQTFNEIMHTMAVYLLPSQPFSLVNNATATYAAVYVFALVFLLCAAVFILSKDVLIKKSAVLYAIFSTIGFFIYYVFIGFTYVYVFKTGITDYHRYINPYYMLWVGGAIIILIIAALLQGKFRKHLQFLVFALAFLGLFRFNTNVQLQLSFIDYPDAVYTGIQRETLRAEHLKSYVQQGDKLFYVNSADTGLNWFQNHYWLLPENILEYSYGGGMFADPQNFKALSADAYVQTGRRIVSLQEFAAYLALYECDYIYIHMASGEFIESYAELFTDGLQGAINEETYLYKVNINAQPIYEEIKPSETYYEHELDENGQVLSNIHGDIRLKMTNAIECVSLTPVDMMMPDI